MCILSVYLDLRKYWKSNFMSLNVLFYFCLFIGLLWKKLVAGKGHYFKALLVILCVQFSKLLVVKRSEASLSCNIDDKKHFGYSWVFLKVNDLTINVFNFKIEEIFDSLLIDRLFLGFEDDLSDYRSHLH
jgi:hypothetical protein